MGGSLEMSDLQRRGPMTVMEGGTWHEDEEPEAEGSFAVKGIQAGCLALPVARQP